MPGGLQVQAPLRGLRPWSPTTAEQCVIEEVRDPASGSRPHPRPSAPSSDVVREVQGSALETPPVPAGAPWRNPREHRRIVGVHGVIYVSTWLELGRGLTHEYFCRSRPRSPASDSGPPERRPAPMTWAPCTRRVWAFSNPAKLIERPPHPGRACRYARRGGCPEAGTDTRRPRRPGSLFPAERHGRPNLEGGVRRVHQSEIDPAPASFFAEATQRRGGEDAPRGHAQTSVRRGLAVLATQRSESAAAYGGASLPSTLGSLRKTHSRGHSH